MLLMKEKKEEKNFHLPHSSLVPLPMTPVQQFSTSTSVFLG